MYVVTQMCIQYSPILIIVIWLLIKSTIQYFQKRILRLDAMVVIININKLFFKTWQSHHILSMLKIWKCVVTFVRSNLFCSKMYPCNVKTYIEKKRAKSHSKKRKNTISFFCKGPLLHTRFGAILNVWFEMIDMDSNEETLYKTTKGKFIPCGTCCLLVYFLLYLIILCFKIIHLASWYIQNFSNFISTKLNIVMIMALLIKRPSFSPSGNSMRPIGFQMQIIITFRFLTHFFVLNAKSNFYSRSQMEKNLHFA